MDKPITAADIAAGAITTEELAEGAVTATAVLDTARGDVEVPISPDAFDQVAEALAAEDPEGWDVLVGLVCDVPEPAVVGFIVRVPGVKDPREAANIAVTKGADMLDQHPEMKREGSVLRVVVQEINGFGES